MDALLEQVHALPTEDKIVFFRRAAEQLTLLELNTLVKSMEKAWDVKAVPQMPDWAQGPNRQDDVAEEAEQTEFDVVVTDNGAKRIGVVKVARVLGEISLKEASDLLKSLPATVLTKVGKDKAEEAKKQLEEAGATVETR